MAYSAWSVIAGEQPTASKWNILGTNDASFNDGTGIAGLYKNLLTVDSNPYKFRAYRNSAWTCAAGTNRVNFDTEVYDTNGNYDNATNYRYTAPVDGFYHFDASIAVAASAGNVHVAYLYKNGSVASRGSGIVTGTTFTQSFPVSDTLQLTAGDYVEVYFTNGSGSGIAGSLGTQNVYFGGFLVSRT